jgi:hypothetical protein
MVDNVDNMREAIGVMTAWATEPGGTKFTAEYFNGLLAEFGATKAADVMGGMISLCGVLLVQAARQNDVTEREILQQIARRYASE